MPVQQSLLVAQVSVGWRQYDTAPEHTPALQNFEQHSELPAHGLPAVLQVPPGMGWQRPPPMPSGWQLPLQHSALEAHAPGGVSGTHALSEHLPPMHAPVQHSVPAAQVVPGALQSVLEGAQMPPAAPASFSQFAVQQSALPAQFWPTGLHTGASESAEESLVMASMKLPPSPASLPPLLLPPLLLLDDVPSTVPSGTPPSSIVTSSSLPQPANVITFTSAIKPTAPSVTNGSRFIA
jgi:hypothetical protein